MSSKYKVRDSTISHFVTFSIVGWVDVFTREVYKEIFTDSLKFCISNKGLILNAWVIMPNHVHLILRTETTEIEYLVRDIKKFTSGKIIQTIEENPLESRRNWMLNLFRFVGSHNSNNSNYQFWNQDYHPIILDTPNILSQKLEYLHDNPVRTGLVWEPWNYKYSSGFDYYSNERGLVPIEHLQLTHSR